MPAARSILALAIAVTHGATHAAAPRDPTGVAAIPEYGMVYYVGGTPRPDEIAITLPSAARLKAIIPFNDGEFAMAGYECAGLTPDGRLQDCSIEVEPQQPRYAAAAASLIAALRAQHPPKTVPGARIEQVAVQLRLINTKRPAARGPCWPPRCVFMPPPQPPLRQRSPER